MVQCTKLNGGRASQANANVAGSGGREEAQKGAWEGHNLSFPLLGCWHPACPTDQPDNPGEENCGVIRTETSGGWQNHDCSIALPYVCKKKPNATAEPIQPGELGHKGLRTSGSRSSSAFLVLQTQSDSDSLY